MLGCPESPAYLASKGKREEAVKVATKLWGAGGAAQLGAGAGAAVPGQGCRSCQRPRLRC